MCSGIKQSLLGLVLGGQEGFKGKKKHLCGLGLCPTLLDLAVGIVFCCLFYHPQMTNTERY